MRTILFYIVLFFTVAASGQTYITVTSSLNGNLTSCLNEVDFRITVNNLSPYNLDNFKLTVVLPDGVTYIPSSGTNGVSDVNISNLDSVILSLPNLAMNTSNFIFDIKLKAVCMVEYTALQNKLIFDFRGDNTTGGIINRSQVFLGNFYNVTFPDLSLVNMTNQSFVGDIGVVFQRCTSITNGGNGALSEFVLHHKHGNGLQILSNSRGTRTTVSDGALYVFSASDFANVGNGDNFLDPGETLIICETIEILSCSNSSQSVYEYSWGCTGESCQIQSDAANIVFIRENPNLVVTRHTGFAISGEGLGNDYCYGDNELGDFPSWIVITNDGTGTSFNNFFEIGQNQGSGSDLFRRDFWSSINPNSLTIEINNGGERPLNTSSLTVSPSRHCLPPNPLDAFSFRIDSIQPGDQIVVRWSHFTCCPVNCTNTNRGLLHWRLRARYENRCSEPHLIPLTGVLPGSNTNPVFGGRQVVTAAPGIIANNNVQTVRFTTSGASYYNIPSNNSGNKFKYQFILPDDCIDVDLSSLLIKNSNETIITSPYTTEIHGDTVEFVFNSSFPTNGWTTTLNFTRNCDECRGGAKSIQLKTYYTPEVDCGCWFPLGCTSTTFDVFCSGGSTCEGISLVSSSVKRTTLGLPDNDNNGIPDLAGTLHEMGSIRLDRLMYGDEFNVVNQISVNNNNNLNFENIVATLDFPLGNRFSYIDATIRIIRPSTGDTFACIIPIPPIFSTTGTNSTRWIFPVSLSSLPCLPLGFNLSTGDKIFLESKFKNVVYSNVGLTSTFVESSVFASVLPYSPVLPDNEKYSCNSELKSLFSLYGFQFLNTADNTLVNAVGCNVITSSQSYHMRIGNTAAGSNPFPFEYRNWGQPEKFVIRVPNDYDFVSARFNYRRTSGNGTFVTSAWIPLTSFIVSGTTYTFDVSAMFGNVDSGALLLNGDDGWDGTIQVNMRPNCTVKDSIVSRFNYAWHNRMVDQLVPSVAPTVITQNHDPIIYHAPKLSIQSNLLTINSQTGSDQWDLLVQNTSTNSPAQNFWIAAPTIGTVVADSIKNTTTGAIIYPNSNGVFSLGTINFASFRNFILYTTSSSCQSDSLRIYAGSDCRGIPDRVSDYACTPLSLLLTVNPLIPSIENSIALISGNNSNMCDTLEFEVLVRNFQLGYAFDLITKAQLVNNLNYVHGSSILDYNGTTNPLTDPVIVSQSLTWDLSNNMFLNHGLVGLTGDASQINNYYRIRFKAVAMCGFASGSRLFVATETQSYCGSHHPSSNGVSLPIQINDLSPKYTTDIKLDIDYILPCGTDNKMTIIVKNNGPAKFYASDSVNITLPLGLTYTNGSFIPRWNALNIQSQPISHFISGLQELRWGLDSTVLAGDSMAFEIDLTSVPLVIPCELIEVRASTTAMITSVCNLGESECEAGVVTGEFSKDIFVYKTDFLISNSSGVLQIDNNGLETVSGSVHLFNQGATLGTTTPFVVNLYADIDNNGVFTPADQLIHTDSNRILVNAGDTYIYNFNNVTVSNICQIIGVLSLENNPCFCDGNVFQIPLQLKSANFYDTICSNDALFVGNSGSGNYSYSWINNSGLSNLTTPQPSFTAINNGLTPTTVELYRTINRSIGCHIRDTSFVVVNPLPNAIIEGNITVCQNDQEPKVTFVGSSGEAPYTFHYRLNGVVNSITAAVDSAHILIPTDLVGTTYVILDSVVDESSINCTNNINDTIRIVINPLIQGTVQGSVVVCQNDTEPIVSFIASGGTAPYTFFYKIDGVLNTISSPTDVAQLSIPTNVIGTRLIVLDSLIDASATYCFNVINDSIEIIINPLPLGEVIGNAIICENDTEPKVSFIASNGTAPYTFYYRLNGVSNFITAAVDSAHILIPTDLVGITYVILDSIVDGSLTNCSNSIFDTVQIRINPLPIGNISGNTIVCENDEEPKVIFVGARGTAPYTFYYTMNGVSNAIISTLDSAEILIPTNVPGTTVVILDSLLDSSLSSCVNVVNDSVRVIVNPLPTGFLSGSTIVCENDNEPIVTFVASRGTAPYTFYYRLNGVSNSITASVDSAQISIATNLVGNTFVILDSIVDASTTYCSTNISDTVRIQIDPLPIGNVIGDIIVCENDPAPKITFIGERGTAPYTFYYTLNDVPKTVVALVDSVDVFIPTNITGLITVILTKVEDASVNRCSMKLNDTVQVQINPLPIGRILGNATVCQHDSEPEVTFVGSRGQAPYTFYYTINGVTESIVAMNDSVKISIPTLNDGIITITLDSIVDASITSCLRRINESVQVLINKLPDAKLIGGDSICLFDAEPILTFIGSNASQYQFDYLLNGELKTINSSNSTITLSVPNNNVGTLQYELVSVKNTITGCKQDLSEIVTFVVHPLPVADFNATHDVIKESDSQVFFENITTGGHSYYWSFGDGEYSTTFSPSHYFEIGDIQQFIITLSVESEFGCKDEKTVTIKTKEEMFVYVPNAFTPDGNEYNNIFIPVITDASNVESYLLVIYNRWGEVIFQSTDLNVGWDGTYKGSICQDGVYTWKLDLQYIFDGDRIRKNGHVTLLR